MDCWRDSDSRRAKHLYDLPMEQTAAARLLDEMRARFGSEQVALDRPKPPGRGRRYIVDLARRTQTTHEQIPAKS